MLTSVRALPQESLNQIYSSDTATISSGSTHLANAIADPDDDFNIFLLFFGTAVVCCMLGFVLLGLFAGMVLIFMFIALLATGILSISIITAWYKKSFLKGFKTLLILLAVVSGAFFSIVSFGLISLLFKLHLDQRTIAISGSLIGVGSGLIVGLLLFKIFRLSLKFIQKKFNLSQHPL